MSRSGCSQIDDSHSLVLDENGWTQVRTGDGVDIYVFAYGNDYKEALNDFYRLTGKTPMLPRYALGNWWSRYYACLLYTSILWNCRKTGMPYALQCNYNGNYMAYRCHQGRASSEKTA